MFVHDKWQIVHAKENEHYFPDMSLFSILMDNHALQINLFLIVFNYRIFAS